MNPSLGSVVSSPSEVQGAALTTKAMDAIRKCVQWPLMLISSCFSTRFGGTLGCHQRNP